MERTENHREQIRKATEEHSELLDVRAEFGPLSVENNKVLMQAAVADVTSTT